VREEGGMIEGKDSSSGQRDEAGAHTNATKWAGASNILDTNIFVIHML